MSVFDGVSINKYLCDIVCTLVSCLPLDDESSLFVCTRLLKVWIYRVLEMYKVSLSVKLGEEEEEEEEKEEEEEEGQTRYLNTVLALTETLVGIA